jgi:hypothetical protein
MHRLDGTSLVRCIAVAGFVAVVITTVLVAPASAHGWQNTTTAEGYELGIHTDPETPVAGTETEFLAHIQNGSAPGRTAQAGGAINETVTVTIISPNGSCDRLTATIPKNGSHFAFSYRFPAAGTYELTARTTIGGEQVTFRTNQQVAASSSAEDTSRTETGSNSRTSQREQGASTTTADGARSNSEALKRKLTTIQFLSGASVVVATGALWAAVMAYRGTD